MTCKYCGKQQPGGVSYCVYCGRKLDEERPRRCQSCGAELVPGTAFCGACGAPVHSDKPRTDNGAARRLTVLAAVLGVVILVLMGIIVVGLVMTGQEDSGDVAALSGGEEEGTQSAGQTEELPDEEAEADGLQSESESEQEAALGWVLQTDYYDLAMDWERAA